MFFLEFRILTINQIKKKQKVKPLKLKKKRYL